MLIDIRCPHCSKLHCRVSKGFYGVVEFICARCEKLNLVSLAMILKQMDSDCDKLPPPATVSTSA